MKRQLLSIIILLLSVSVSILAINPSTIRQKAMGGVSVASPFNNSPVYVNPAFLAYSENDFTFPNILFEYPQDDNTIKAVTDLSELMQDGNVDLVKVLDTIKGLVGVKTTFKGAINPILSASFGSFGLGMYAESSTFLRFYDPVSPKIEFKSQVDVMPVVGYGFEPNFLEDTAIGISGRYINSMRVYNKDDGSEYIQLGASDVLELVNESENRKEFSQYSLSGFSLDLGALHSFSLFGNQSWAGLSLKNVVGGLSGTQERNTTTGSTINVDMEETLDMTGTIGVSTELPVINRISFLQPYTENMVVAADYDFIGDFEYAKEGLHLGIEQPLFANVLVLRGGLNQGYVVGGFGLDFKIFHLDYANYVDYTESQGKIPHHGLMFGFGW